MSNRAIFLHGQRSKADTWKAIGTEAKKFLDSRSWEVEVVGPAATVLYDGPNFRKPQSQPCVGSLQHHIDCALLSAHASHGEITYVNAGSSGYCSVFLRRMAPECHYLFLFSCRVMAHGAPPYDKPWLRITPGFPNVFKRWKHALNQRVRMICGGAGQIGVDGCSAKRALRPIVDLRLPVSNSFLLEVSTPRHIGSCLTRGDRDPVDTPLCTDKRFVDKDNPFTYGNFAYLQYPVWQDSSRAKDYWSFYFETASTAPEEHDEESSPQATYRASPPMILELETVFSSDSTKEILTLVQELKDDDVFDAETLIDVHFSAEIGMVNVSLRIANPPGEIFDQRKEWRYLVAKRTEILGTELMHLSDASGNFRLGAPGLDAIQMWISRVPFGKSKVDADLFVKDESARLHPRLIYETESDKVLIPILSPECVWMVRVAPQDEQEGQKSVRSFEADIVVGGFNIVEAHNEGQLIQLAEAAQRAKSWFDRVNPTDAEIYELDADTARCGYKLIHTNEGPRFVLVYRFHLRSIHGHELEGRQVDIPAFDSEAALFRDLAPLVYD